MAVSVGEEVELQVEKPASGGRMIARHEGEVVLVAGAIPGERVLARVTRADKRLAFATTLRVVDPSKDRRAAAGDPACGGCQYAFIEYERQLELKSQIVADAFLRIGRIPLEAPVVVAGSPEREYRMRARFHVQDGTPGFYREGTHELCDPRQTGQLLEASIDAVETAVASLSAQGHSVVSVELSENIAADQRALHIDVRGKVPSSDALERTIGSARLTGCTVRADDTGLHTAGDPIVSDPLTALTNGRAAAGTLARHPAAFFQGNRFLIGSLVSAVMQSVEDGPVLDLYAGVGLFSIALAAAGLSEITAVEGDPFGSRDLLRNATPYLDRVRVHHASVEAYLGRETSGRGTLIVDPPRTGISKQALDAIAASGARRIVYVACDVATMARDARRLLEADYRLTTLEGFDLFPNTPHVETLGVFDSARISDRSEQPTAAPR